MVVLIQRVSSSQIRIAGACIAKIGAGLLVFVGVEPLDTVDQAATFLDRIIKYRMFDDDHGRMNKNLLEIEGDLLLVPQFTLLADTRRGLRPGFSNAASPDHGRAIFQSLVETAKARHRRVESGRFGAHMKVELVNDGPVTFWLETR